MQWWTLFSFIGFTALVAVLTWIFTRKADHGSRDGFFLAGRSLTFPFIAGSLLLTNLSTEQMVGLNGSAFTSGLSVMAWEVVGTIGLVLMALFFLPRFLKSGVATVPEYLELRFDKTTAVITNCIFLVAYMVILLPIILYTGATGLLGMLNLQELFGISSPTTALWLLVFAIGLIGSVYALWGGLKSVAFSDTMNGIGLLTGGFMITYFGFAALGDGSFVEGIGRLAEILPEEKFNSIGHPASAVPFDTLFTGILFINVFYWCTNQQIIQRTLGAKSLAEGQKGVLLCGLLKLLGPLYLVLPGMIAAALFAGEAMKSDDAYGRLVNAVLPGPLAGFFAAAILGAILSSFNSALNSTCTLFSLGIYRGLCKPAADDAEVVRVGRWFGWIVALISMCVAPLLAGTGGIFEYLQRMNGIYFIPILAVVAGGMIFRFTPAPAARLTLVLGVVLIAVGYFVPPFSNYIAVPRHQYHFLALVLAGLLLMMWLWGRFAGRPEPFVQQDAKVIAMTPFRYLWPISVILVLTVATVYAIFADFSVYGN